jgi:D-alanine-D-alanine ligase
MLHIGILRGGSPDFFEHSLEQGNAFLKNLPEDAYTVHDIFLNKDGQWHRRGQQMRLGDALRGIDVAVPLLLGSDAESGEVLYELERQQIPFTGSGRSATRHACGKHHVHSHLRDHKNYIKNAGLRTEWHIPQQHIIERTEGSMHGSPADHANHVFTKFGPPYIVKPAHGSHSHYVEIAKTVHDLPRAIDSVMQQAHDSVVVEPRIGGADASVYVIDGFRNQAHYTLPPVKAVIGDFDTHITRDHKLDEASLAQCPAPFSHEVKKQLEDAAKEVHRQLKLAHYSKIDFKVTPNGVYILEANSHPNIGEKSMIAKPLETVGSSLSEFYRHIIDRAYRFKKV